MKKNDKIIKILITTMFILLPIIDILRGTPIKDIEVFNISVLEIFNLIIIVSSFILTIPKIKKKHIKYFFIYFLIIGTYLLLHTMNVYKFNINVLPYANPNYIQEIYYIIRVYILPLLLMIILFENKNIFNKKYYLNIVKYLVLFISGSIILLNICRFSYSSYTTRLTEFIINKTSFYDVFTHEGNFKELLTIGLFTSANKTAIILFMLLPINIYNLYLNPKLKNMLLIILQSISMIIIGTKVAALGAILVLIATLLMYYFFCIIKKEKFDKKYNYFHLSAMIISIIVISISPFKHVFLNDISNKPFVDEYSEEKIEEVKNTIDIEMTDDEFAEYLTEYRTIFKIDMLFIEMYPIENDKEFWLSLCHRDRRLNNDFRNIKNDIMARIMEKNDNKYDKYLGMGYTIGTQDMEKDYVYQYYLFGIIGLILLIGVYIYIYFYNILKVFKKSYFNYNFCICLVPPFLGLVACYFSGHLFGWVTPMIILATTLCLGRVNE